MPKPSAEFVYDISSSPVIAHGLSFSDTQINEMLQSSVKEILQDTSGMKTIGELLSSVATTDFEQAQIDRIISKKSKNKPPYWRVGEAIAQAFVTNKGKCQFPWPAQRDLKNPKASPAGCDLVGYQQTNSEKQPHRLAFGEVKTSRERKSPPGVMSSLRKQLQALHSNTQVKDDLLRYLAHHTLSTPNHPHTIMYKNAAARYLQSNGEDIAIYGILIRDAPPQQTDISSGARTLAGVCSKQTNIEIYALYLPQGSILSLSERAAAAMKNDGKQ